MHFRVKIAKTCYSIIIPREYMYCMDTGRIPKDRFCFCFALQDAKTGGAHYREITGKIARARACFVSPLVAGQKSVNTIF